MAETTQVESPASLRIALSRIGVKMPLIISGLVAVTILVMMLANFFLTQRIISTTSEEKLQGLGTLTAKRVVTLLESIDREISLRAETPTTRNALLALTDGYQSLENAEEVLRRVYITENEHPVGKKDRLLKADTGSSYGFIHAIYHTALHNLQIEMGYYDIFLLDTKGNLVYSVFKENDFATNLMEGKWKDTGLGEVFRGAMELASDDPSKFVDFAPYAPSNGAPAAFIARPVFNEQGVRLGVIAYQMPNEMMTTAAGDLAGLGETTDGFLVGADGYLRTDSGMTEIYDVLDVRYDAEVTAAAISGGSGIMELIETNGRDVVASYQPVDFLGTRWAMIVQEDRSELFDGITWAFNRAIVIALLVLLAIVTLSIFISRRMAMPVQRLTLAVRQIADGALHTELPERERIDEFGDLAQATEVLRLNSLKVVKMGEEQEAANKEMAALAKEREAAIKREIQTAKENEEQDQKTAQEREEMMLDLRKSFGFVVEGAIGGEFTKRVDASFSDQILNDLAQSINQLMSVVDGGLGKTGQVLSAVAKGDLTQRMEGEFQGAFGTLQNDANHMIDSLKSLVTEISASGDTIAASSTELRDTAEVLSHQSESNAASLEESSAALEELSASLSQVKSNASEASKNAQQARDTAKSSEKVAAEAAASMESIADASQEIGRAVDVINEIAFQINLLALNAGVEAARAGDAGRGFSVVASEVRQLAQKASEASTDIAKVISKSDIAVSEGVVKVADAQSSLEAIAKRVIGISNSVDEISSAISEQASGITEITTAINQIDQSTQKQTASFEEVTAAGAVLAHESEGLRTSTARFATGGDTTVVPISRPAAAQSPIAERQKVAAVAGMVQTRDDGWDEF